MAEKPVTRRKAITWTAVLYVLAVVVNIWVMGHWYSHTNSVREMALGFLLYSGLYACSFFMGLKADPDLMRRGMEAGFQTILRNAPLHVGGFLALELFVFALLDWSWLWRSLGTLFGLVAGAKWAKQEISLNLNLKPEEKEFPPIDIWKP